MALKLIQGKQLNVNLTGSFTGSFSGSFNGTSSYATQALSASYALSSSYSTNISGTTNYVSKFTGDNTLGNSLIYDNGTSVGLGTTAPSARLHLIGSGSTSGSLSFLASNALGTGSFRIYDNGTISNPGFNPLLDNEAFGRNALESIDPATPGLGATTALGPYALRRATQTRTTTAIGYGAMSNTSGSAVTSSIAIGYFALTNQQSGSYNIGIGHQAMQGSAAVPVTGNSNLAIGAAALFYLQTGSFNIAIGQQALQGTVAAPVTGDRNLAIGVSALRQNTTGTRNNAVGDSSLGANTVGSFNTANGNRALQANTSGSYNSAIGIDALVFQTSASFNTGIGAQSLYDGTLGDSNTGIGYNTGRGITIGRANTIIGAKVTGLASTLSNTIILADGDGNQKFIISSASIATLSGSLNVTNGITGSLFGTSSFATTASNALTASYVNPLNQKVIITGSLINGLAGNVASGPGSHAEGVFTVSSGESSHAEGVFTVSSGDYSHAEGDQTIASGPYSHAEGAYTLASGSYSHAEGGFAVAQGNYSHAEGIYTVASGQSSHAEGVQTIASGDYSHAEGVQTIASGDHSHAEGVGTTASGNSAHAEGAYTLASGSYSHAEGGFAVAQGNYSHAEGIYTVASGDYSHAEGSSTIASGASSHAEGLGTIALGDYQHVQGQYNISSSAQSAFIIGNGTSDADRSNLIFASGSQVQITGSLTVTNGITGSLFGTSSWATNAQNAGTASHILGGSATHIPFFKTDTTLATSSMYQSGSSTIIINQDNATTANPEALYVWQPHPTSFNVVSGKGNVNNYLQLNIHNTNQGTAASSDVVATADNGNETINYVDMGINSENFSGPIGGPNDAYLYSAGQHLHIGNITPNKPIQFFVGGPDSNADRKLELNANGQHNMTGSLEIDESLTVLGGITGSLLGTASYALQALSASWAPYQASASYALSSSYAETASYAPSYLPLTGGTINGDVIVNGTASIAFLNVQYESASVIYSSGSNVFGDATDDTQTLNGTVLVSGSQQITGSLSVSQGITGTLFGTASYAVTASYLNGGTNGFVQGGNSFGTTALLGTNDNQSLALETSGSTRMFISSSGNVGIGTATPGSKLEVFGTGKAVILGNGTSADTYIDLAGDRGQIGFESATGIRIQGTATRPIVFGIGAWGTGEVVRISTTGLVGIGTTAPTAKLHIAAPGSGSTDIALRVRNSTDSADLMTVNGVGQLAIDKNYGLKFLLSSVITSPSDGSITLSNSAGTSFNLLRFGGSTSSFPAIKRNGVGIDFRLADDSNYATITVNQLFYQGALINTNYNYNRLQTGAVVGASGDLVLLPSAVLQANSTTQGFLPPRTNLTSNITAPAQGLITYLTGSTNEGLYYYNSGSTPGWRQVADTTFISASVSGSTNYLPKFSGSNALANSLVYDNGTNVGIGTTSPGGKFEVNDGIAWVRATGAALDLGYSTETVPRVRLSRDIVGAAGGIIFTAGGAVANSGTAITQNGSGNLVLLTSNGTALTERVRINSSGNVGIGTTVPVSRLHVEDSTLAGSGALSGSAVTIVQNFSTSANTGAMIKLIGTQTGPGFRFLEGRQNGSITFYIGHDGSAQFLDVNGRTFNGVFTSNTNNSGAGSFNYLQTITSTANQKILNFNATYNQTSGGASNTDIFLNRTTTAVGSGSQYLMDLQSNTISRFNVTPSGSVNISGSLTVTGSITGSLFGTSSWAVSASWAPTQTIDTGSLVTTASFNSFTSSYNTGSFTGSFTGSLLGIASNSLTASYINPLTQNVTITGSFLVSGSTTQIGDNNLLGNTYLSGSINISGNTFLTGSLTALNQTASFGYVSASFLDITGKQVVKGFTQYLPTSDIVPIDTVGGYIYSSGSEGDLYFAQTNGSINNVIRLRWLEGNMYSGLLNGGVITTQSSTVYQVSSGSGIIVSLNGSLSSDPYPAVQYISWSNLSSSIAPLSASFDQSFVAIEASGSTGIIYTQGTPYDDGQFNSLIPIGNVIHQNRSSINATATYPSVAYGYKQRSSDFIRAFGPLKLSGLDTIVSGSSTGSLQVTSGKSYSEGRNYVTDVNNPSYVQDTGQPISKIFRYYQSGSSWVYLTNGGAGFETIDPTQYSLNGVLTPVPGTGINREFTIQRVFYFPGGATKGIYVYYGNQTYSTALDAIANIPYESFIEAPNTSAGAVLSAYVIVRNNADFTDTDSYNIRPAGLFRNIGGTGGAGGAIAQTLSGLSDVDVLTTLPTNGQPLVYDSATLKWTNKSTLTANLTGTASFATTASYISGVVATASFATTASNVLGGTANYIPLWNTNTSLTSSVLYQSASNIGIGTTTPAYKLYVTDTVNTNGIIAGLFGGVSYGAALSYSRGGNYSWTTGIGNAGGAPTSFFTISEQGTTPRLVIAHTTGNVGIGTTAPSSKLDVIGGDIGISLNSWFGSYYNGQTTLRPILGFNNGNTILRSVAGTTGINFQNSSGITKMFLSETSGNVGIETTAPSASLHVQGTVMISSSIFQYSNNAAIVSGSTANIASFAISSYMAGFFDFVASSGANARAGTIFTVWNGTSLEYVETSTNDIGSTTNLILSASLSGSNVLLQGTSLSGTWSVKTLTRMI